MKNTKKSSEKKPVEDIKIFIKKKKTKGLKKLGKGIKMQLKKKKKKRNKNLYEEKKKKLLEYRKITM